uniref:Major facilitator superfamily (MFS) profile domain-containing protein n=1 Tax=Glossina palpalis gambiensis TaxID=67801 RepID=A0A1B0BDM3_9MUSC
MPLARGTIAIASHHGYIPESIFSLNKPFSVITPIYTTELAQTVLRGYLGAFFQMAVVLGILFSFVAGFYLSIFNTIVACAIVPCVSSLLFIALPESPKKRTCLCLRGKDYDLKHDFVEIVIFIQQSKENPYFSKSIRQPPTSLALFYTILLMLFQQFGGISAIMFYTMDIFDKSKGGMSTQNSMLLVGIVQSIATFIAIYLMDLVGRRIPLLISCDCDSFIKEYNKQRLAGEEISAPNIELAKSKAFK